MDAHIIQLNRKSYKSPNLTKILEDPKIKKIFHFARADVSFLQYYLKANINNIECTKIKSKLSRTYTDKHGLKDLIKEVIGIDISKQYQSSDFGGKLSDQQIKYCANDVIYLHKINVFLDQLLLREKRMDLYKKTISFIKKNTCQQSTHLTTLCENLQILKFNLKQLYGLLDANSNLTIKRLFITIYKNLKTTII